VNLFKQMGILFHTVIAACITNGIKKGNIAVAFISLKYALNSGIGKITKFVYLNIQTPFSPLEFK
jgi:hypothetical protein